MAFSLQTSSRFIKWLITQSIKEETKIRSQEKVYVRFYVWHTWAFKFNGLSTFKVHSTYWAIKNPPIFNIWGLEIQGHSIKLYSISIVVVLPTCTEKWQYYVTTHNRPNTYSKILFCIWKYLVLVAAAGYLQLTSNLVFVTVDQKLGT